MDIIDHTGWYLLSVPLQTNTVDNLKTQWGIPNSTIGSIYQLDPEDTSNNHIVNGHILTEEDWKEVVVDDSSGTFQGPYWVYIEYDSNDDGEVPTSITVLNTFDGELQMNSLQLNGGLTTNSIVSDSNDTIDIGDSNVSVNVKGDLTVDGNLTANSIVSDSNDTIDIGDSNVSVNVKGDLTVSGVLFTTNIESDSQNTAIDIATLQNITNNYANEKLIARYNPESSSQSQWGNDSYPNKLLQKCCFTINDDIFSQESNSPGVIKVSLSGIYRIQVNAYPMIQTENNLRKSFGIYVSINNDEDSNDSNNIWNNQDQTGRWGACYLRSIGLPNYDPKQYDGNIHLDDFYLLTSDDNIRIKTKVTDDHQLNSDGYYGDTIDSNEVSLHLQVIVERLYPNHELRVPKSW